MTTAYTKAGILTMPSFLLRPPSPFLSLTSIIPQAHSHRWQNNYELLSTPTCFALVLLWVFCFGHFVVPPYLVDQVTIPSGRFAQLWWTAEASSSAVFGAFEQQKITARMARLWAKVSVVQLPEMCPQV